MINTNFLFLTFILSVFFSISVHAQINPDIEKQIDEIFTADVANPFGGAIALIKNDDVIFNKGYGLANREYNIPVDTNSVFDIASLTKHFTAFSIFLLEERGLLSLADDVSKYIEDFPFKNKHITINHLLHHTSGIRDYIHLQKVAGHAILDNYTNDMLLDFFRKQETLNFEPGSSVLYSNTNYLLLAEIVKKASSLSLDSFCSQNIFKPLKMNNTYFLNDQVVNSRVTSYFKSENGQPTNWLSSSNAQGPVGAHATAADVAKWLGNLSTGSVGGKQVVDKFLSSTQLHNGANIHTNSCVMAKKTYNGENLFLSNGSMGGFRSQVFYFPDTQTGIVLFSNSGDAVNVYVAACRIADLLLGHEPAVRKKQKRISKNYIVKNKSRFEGQYDLGGGFKVSVKEIDKTLKVKSTWDEEYLEMIPIDTNAFLVDHDDYRNKEIRFTYNVQENKYVFVYNSVTSGYQYEYIHFNTQELREFEGIYYSRELQTIYTIKLKDSTLIAYHRVNGEVALTPMKNLLFEGGRWYFDKIKFIRNDKGVINGFNLDLDRISNLEFIRLKEIE